MTQRRRLTNAEIIRNIVIGAILTFSSLYCLGLSLAYSLFKQDRVDILKRVDRLGWTDNLTAEWNEVLAAEAEFISNNSILEFAFQLPAPVQLLAEFALIAISIFGIAVLSANIEKLQKRWKEFSSYEAA